MRNVVHVTHEAVEKIGGIGAVLEGLLTSGRYQEAVGRSILIGPLFTTEGPADKRLGPDGEVLYSSVDGLTGHPVGKRLEEIRRTYNVELVYGRRRFGGGQGWQKSDPEVLLIEISNMDLGQLNSFKAGLYSQFDIESDRYERSWEYEQYVKIAQPAIAALKALGMCDEECVILAHEFMGMPTALAAILDGHSSFRTVFYAHEVAPIRKIVEEHSGHDTMFYNVLGAAMANGLHVEDVFDSQRHYFKFALVEASKHCDNILAVGDYVVKELMFMGRGFEQVDIDLSYNGIPAAHISLEQSNQSKARLQQYTENLLGYRPDYVFSHVSRMALSKGFWRDILVLEHMERHFRQTGQTAVLFVLSSEIPRRRPEDIYEMERWWRWPVAHREGLPDLSGGEALFYTGVQEFNARSRNIKIVLVNQFGWDCITCGHRMPEEMQFMDIRMGTDVEFGQSIYEPFGIAQLEPLSFGGICVISRVCGCAGFVDDVSGGRDEGNVITADYTDVGWPRGDLAELLGIDRQYREQVEAVVAKGVADRLIERLPHSEADQVGLIERGYELARQMSWDAVVSRYVLPGMDRACRKCRVWQVA